MEGEYWARERVRDEADADAPEPLGRPAAAGYVADLVAALREYHALMGNLHAMTYAQEDGNRERWIAAAREAQKRAQAALQRYRRESIAILATVRDGDTEWHVECRMPDGQKGAFVTVDYEFPDLAHRIAGALGDTALPAT